MTWNSDKPEPLFKRLDLEEILEHEQSLASNSESSDKEVAYAIKGGKKEEKDEQRNRRNKVS